jgi:hypothetical protein
MVQKMSLEELVAQTFLRYPCSTGPCVPEALNGSLNATGVGTVSIRVVTDTSGPGSSALAALRLRNAVQSSLVATSRLKVPASFEEEGLHCGAWGGTIFPGAIGLGATWNEGLVREVGEIIALEARAAGVDTVYAPEVNMFDPRSGRYCEGISEDPTLTSRLGAAMVVGLQGPRIQGPRARGARSVYCLAPPFFSHIPNHLHHHHIVSTTCTQPAVRHMRYDSSSCFQLLTLPFVCNPLDTAAGPHALGQPAHTSETPRSTSLHSPSTTLSTVPTVAGSTLPRPTSPTVLSLK